MSSLSALIILRLKQRANWTRKGELSPVKGRGNVFPVLQAIVPTSPVEGIVTLRH